MISGSFSLPYFSTMEFIVFIILIYFFIRVLAKISGYIRHLRKFQKRIKNILPVIDLAMLVIALFWITHRIFSNSDALPYITTALTIILLILLGWFWGRDFVAGIILKSENYFELNKKIQLNNKSGKIIKTTLRYLEFETDDGESVRVPYSKISNDYFSKLSPDEKFESHQITLFVKEVAEPNTLRESIRKNIYNSPWYLAGKEPVIEIDSSAEGGYKINLNIYTINSSQADLIRQELAAKLTD